jgi:hypothetical protein
LVHLVKNTLGEHSPADEILSKLAEKPLTYHLMEKQSWKQIEESLLPEYEGANDMENDILQLVELGAICECENSEEWVETASHELLSELAGLPNALSSGKESLQAYVSQLTARRRIHWSKQLGGFVSSS